MVIPVLTYHLERHTKAKHTKNGRNDGVLLLGQLLNNGDQTCHTHADPDGEGIERTRVSVVTFSWLIRSLIEVEDDGQTRHEEEEEYHPEALNTLLTRECLPKQTNQAKNEWQHVIDIVALVLADGSRHMILIAYEYLVDELDASNPIAAVDLSITLHIALATREVPKEVTPIHEVDLIAQEILHVFGESGNGDGLAIDTNLLTLEVTPLLVTLDMITLL